MIKINLLAEGKRPVLARKLRSPLSVGGGAASRMSTIALGGIRYPLAAGGGGAWADSQADPHENAMISASKRWWRMAELLLN